jgi:hypothetical protein
MATFNAGDVVEALDWDFRGIDPKTGHPHPGWPRELSTAKGTIKEPSDQAITTFLEDMRNLSTDAARLDANARKIMEDLGTDADPDQIAAALKDLPVGSMMTMMAGMSEAFSKLCGGHPTPKQILALPMRVRVAFFNWIQREVVSPEAGSGGGIAPVIALPAAAGGSSST